MQLTTVKIRTLQPPQDDLLSVLDEVLPKLEEKSIVVLASKVVAIHEGRCVPDPTLEKREELIQSESDHIIKSPVPGGWDLTIKNDMVSFAGGVDESNAGGYLILLPEDPNRSAREIREYLKQKYGLKELGVIITDSTGLPFRDGVIGLSIGHAGFMPTNNHKGKTDLFGRPFVYTVVDVVDSIAVPAAFVMGETDESTPVCLVTEVPHITFTDEDHSSDLKIKPEADVFYPLFKDYY